MISKSGNNFDIVLISGEYYDDHPLSPVGVIARVLDAKGYHVGIIEKPKKKSDFVKLGKPTLCFCVSSGSFDSMVHNYTPLKRKRISDKHIKVSEIPDRAILFYCNEIKRYFQDSIIVIGGIESSLRRFAHYDYWDNKIRRSILLDSRANILVYGNGEKQIIEIAKRLKNKQHLKKIKGTCIVTKDLHESVTLLPSYKEVSEEKRKFCIMQQEFSISKDLAQEYTNNYVLQYQYPHYTTEDLDWIYALPFTRKLHPKSSLKMAQFSIVTHRGCIGNCNFCSIALHQGNKIISRSEENIINEIQKITKHPAFKGYVDDLGGPSANMYGMDCKRKHSCNKNCLQCESLDDSHEKIRALLKKARNVKGIKKIFIRSGIRYDLALRNKAYINELSRYHLSGCLKIAPEHFSQQVLDFMNKDNTRFHEFVSLFNQINSKNNQSLRYYFMIGHPGDTIENVEFLRNTIQKLHLKNIENFQFFTPTPMTNSTCMYWTGMNVDNFIPINIMYDYNTKKKMKRILLHMIP